MVTSLVAFVGLLFGNLPRLPFAALAIPTAGPVSQRQALPEVPVSLARLGAMNLRDQLEFAHALGRTSR
jgi:hypothetical protein